MSQYVKEVDQRSGSQMKPTQKIALIVDNDKQICRMLKRILMSGFDVVITATSPLEAEALLKTWAVTHLICDYGFGPDEPEGFEVVAKWRKECPSICRTVVLAGSDISGVHIPDEVDLILTKNVPREKLFRALWGSNMNAKYHELDSWLV
ncbi:MAG: response regulator [Proteobacteria bacterium]|nr:response regulator [Pseudomonadota bacterium]